MKKTRKKRPHFTWQPKIAGEAAIGLATPIFMFGSNQFAVAFQGMVRGWSRWRFKAWSVDGPGGVKCKAGFTEIEFAVYFSGEFLMDGVAAGI
jgi:hypothetical protein